jgi:hypothetical protein
MRTSVGKAARLGLFAGSMALFAAANAETAVALYGGPSQGGGAAANPYSDAPPRQVVNPHVPNERCRATYLRVPGPSPTGLVWEQVDDCPQMQ